MPDGIDPEWLARTMASCSSADEPVRRAAWDALARVIWPYIVAEAKKQQRRSWASTSSLTIAEDAAMHAFTKLMECIERVEPDKLFGWVYVVVRNYIISLGKRGFHAYESVAAVDDTWANSTRQIQRDMSQVLSPTARLIEEIKDLPEASRELLFARFWLGMTLDEIGRELGYTRREVSKRLRVAHDHLRSALTEAGYTDSSGATTDFG